MNPYPSHRRSSILRDAAAIESEAAPVARAPRRLRVGTIVLVETTDSCPGDPKYALPGGGTATLAEAWRICVRNGWPRPEVVSRL